MSMGKYSSELNVAAEFWIVICLFAVIGLAAAAFGVSIISTVYPPVLLVIGAFLGAVIGVVLARIKIIRSTVAGFVCSVIFWWS